MALALVLSCGCTTPASNPAAVGNTPSADGGGSGDARAVVAGDAAASDSALVSMGDGGCSPIPTSDLPSGSSPVSGSIVGSGLTATVCPGGASARIESEGASYDTASYFFDLTWAVGSAVLTDFEFQAPAAANNGEVDVLVGIASPTAGDYDSSAAPNCGFMSFTYYLPVPPNVDCDAGPAPASPGACPAGCSTVCSGFGCLPCEPQPPSVGYTGANASDCIGDITPVVGSWHLSLTSVDLDADAGTGSNTFTPHGTFTATMVGETSTADTIALSLSF